MSSRNEELISSVYPSATTNIDQPVNHLQGRGSSTDIIPIETDYPVAITGVDPHVRSPDSYLKPVPLEPIREQIDLSSSALRRSLISLKNTAALVERIPYLPALATLLLQVLTTQDDLDQHTERYNATKDKVRKIAALVCNVGRICEDDNLEEDDLPPSLPTILYCCETDLRPFDRALKQSSSMGAIKRVLLGMYFRWKVKRFDAKFSSVLRVFQATLTSDPLFSRCAEGIEVEVTNVDARYDDDQTPLHVASQLGQHQVISSLIDRGADPNAVNAFKETPLSLASRNGNTEVASVLLSRGARVNHVDSENRTSLHEASELGRHAIAKLLFEYQANPDSKNAYEWTALHLASRTGNLAVVKTLLGHDAEVNVVNKSLWTPLHLASQEGHVEVVESLLVRGARVDERNADGETALHLAAYYGRMRVVEVLIRYQADRQVRNQKQKTALDLARDRSCCDIVQLLEEAEISRE